MLWKYLVKHYISNKKYLTEIFMYIYYVYINIKVNI